ELLDVLARLLVLALGERVHGAQRLAAARQALELTLDLLALLVAERLGDRLDLAPQRLGDTRQLHARLVAAVGEVRDLHLGLGDRLPGGAQPGLDLGLLA